MMAAASAALSAQGSSQLPLRTSGLEHIGFTVPDPQKSAAFYGRIFDPQIFQEMMPPLRYYCRLGIGYVAFGPNANAQARIDHFCATVEDYRLDDMRAELKHHGLNLTGSAGFNAVTDPDGGYRIDNVPPGNYNVFVWNESLPLESRRVTVPEAGGDVELNVSFSRR